MTMNRRVVCEARDKCGNPDCIHSEEHVFGRAYIELKEIPCLCRRSKCHLLGRITGVAECECVHVGDLGDEEDII